MQIYCPKCEWQPDGGAYWQCAPAGCKHIWNTFETMGKCPSCSRIWHDTACPKCSRWSRHMSWYHIDGVDDQEEVRTIVEETTAPPEGAPRKPVSD